MLAGCASYDVQPVRWCVRRHTVWNRAVVTFRAVQELHRPLGDSPLLNTQVLSWRRLLDVLLLQDEREWFLGSFRLPRKVGRLGEGCECAEIVVAFVQVGGTSLRMTPDPVFQDLIPHVPTASLSFGWVGANFRRLHDCRVRHQ